MLKSLLDLLRKVSLQKQFFHCFSHWCPDIFAVSTWQCSLTANSYFDLEFQFTPISNSNKDPYSRYSTGGRFLSGVNSSATNHEQSTLSQSYPSLSYWENLVGRCGGVITGWLQGEAEVSGVLPQAGTIGRRMVNQSWVCSVRALPGWRLGFWRIPVSSRSLQGAVLKKLTENNVHWWHFLWSVC